MKAQQSPYVTNELLLNENERSNLSKKVADIVLQPEESPLHGNNVTKSHSNGVEQKSKLPQPINYGNSSSEQFGVVLQAKDQPKASNIGAFVRENQLAPSHKSPSKDQPTARPASSGSARPQSTSDIYNSKKSIPEPSAAKPILLQSTSMEERRSAQMFSSNPVERRTNSTPTKPERGNDHRDSRGVASNANRLRGGGEENESGPQSHNAPSANKERPSPSSDRTTRLGCTQKILLPVFNEVTN